jgi:aspartyl-tRNA(Asn)/glutamyl-tRNA(Gln) amidotransferase subunit A
MGIMSATTPLSVTGLPGISMRFGTSYGGMPIGVQIVGNWQAESTILHAAALLEQVSPVWGLHPNL